MIALDPEFLGGFAPQSQFTEGTGQSTMPFARQPRLHRLHIQGKVDKREDASEDEVMESLVDSSHPSNCKHHQTRGKDKRLKRLVNHLLIYKPTRSIGSALATGGSREKMSLTQEL